MGFNINTVHKDSVISVLYRAELKHSWGNVPAGTKGWITWSRGELTFELDEPIHISGVLFTHRIIGYVRKLFRNPKLILAKKIETSRRLLKSIKRLEATDEERLTYFMRHYGVCRRVNGSGHSKNVDYNKIEERLKSMLSKQEYLQANNFVDLLMLDIDTGLDKVTPHL